MAASSPSSSSSPRPPLRETIDEKLRDTIAKGAVDRGEGQLKSLAHEHLDLRSHPPRGCLLLSKGAPYSSINMDRLRGFLPHMLVEKHPSPSLIPLCELGFERGLFRCFIECTPVSRDPWQPKRLFCRSPLSAIKTTVDSSLKDTRVFKAYGTSLRRSAFQPSVTSQVCRAPFEHPTLAVRMMEDCTVVDAIVATRRFEPIADTGIALNVDEELYNDAINFLSPEKRHELHVRHCCPWSGMIEQGGCRCPNYSPSDPRTRLPPLLPLLAFGTKGVDTQRKIVEARISDPEYIAQRRKEHAASVWIKSVKRLNGPVTRTCVAEALLRLLAAYEMCGAVYGSAVITTRFTRFFVLAPNRIAVEILDKPRSNFGGVPKPLPWNVREQSEARRAYVEKMPKPVAHTPTRPPTRPPLSKPPSRRVVSETRPPLSTRPPSSNGGPRHSLPAPQTPPRTPSPTPGRPSMEDHASFVRYGLPPIGNIPAAHLLRTPPRQLTWKDRMKKARPSLNSQQDSPKSVAGSETSQQNTPKTPRTPKTKNVNKPLPVCPEPVLPSCPLPPDSRTSLSYKEMFTDTDDLFERLPWSFATWVGGSKPGQSRISTSSTLDRDAVQAFSNLLTAAIIRIGQMPLNHPNGPLPITNQFPRDDTITALSQRTGLPAELAERIVDQSLALDEQPFVQAVRQEHFEKDRERKLNKTVHRLPLVSRFTTPAIVHQPVLHIPLPNPPPVNPPPPTTPSAPRARRPTATRQSDLWAMEQALDATVRFVPVSRGEMEALIGRQVRADRRRYFHTYSKKLWPEYWLLQQQAL